MRLRLILGLTAASALLPGLAHLRAGRRGSGLALLGAFYAAVIGTVVIGVIYRERLPELAVRPELLLGLTFGAPLLGLGWALLVLRSYVVLRTGLTPWKRHAGIVLAGVLSVVILAPFAAVAHYAHVQRDLVTTLFAEEAATGPVQPLSVPRPASPVGPADPPTGRDRMNILLLGSDAGPGRIGVRTDTLVLASIAVATGRTVLLSLPRNLQRVPFPADSPMRQRFPRGFDNLLNAVWGYANRHPDMVPGARNPGAELLKATVGHVLGLPVDHFAMVNMAGFATLVDAIGGVKVTVDRPIRWGDQGVVFRPGTYRLDGRRALMFARSRTGTSDYSRMTRQRCMLGWIAQQARPMTVLARYQRLAKAAKELVSTDIPRRLLPALVGLAPKVKDAQITSVTFMPPLITPARPDWTKIRSLAKQAIRASDRGTATPEAARDLTEACH